MSSSRDFAKAAQPDPAQGGDDPGLWLARITAMSQGLIAQQERERQFIAHELHDEIGQCLSVIRVQFARLQRRVQDEELQEFIDGASAVAERALDHVRNLALNLYPPQLETLGLESALRRLVTESGRMHGADIRLSTHGLSSRVGREKSLAAYRIVQEALSNALRHGGARHIEVSVHEDQGALYVDVTDDGCGFDPAAVQAALAQRPSLGLLGMAERARLLGGSLRIDSKPGRGTHIAAAMPCRDIEQEGSIRNDSGKSMAPGARG